MAHQENPTAPILCAAGCGFYGNPQSLNLCSKCYKDHANNQPQPVATKKEEPAAPVMEECKEEAAFCPPVSTPAAAPSAAVEEKAEPSKPVQKSITRCFECNKKIGLTGFKCRCEFVYCAAHRYSDMHNCQFDYKSEGQNQLKKANPVVKASKLDGGI